MLKPNCRNLSLVDNMNPKDELTEVNPDFMRENKTKYSRTDYPEVIDSFNSLVSGINLLLWILWNATE